MSFFVCRFDKENSTTASVAESTFAKQRQSTGSQGRIQSTKKSADEKRSSQTAFGRSLGKPLAQQSVNVQRRKSITNQGDSKVNSSVRSQNSGKAKTMVTYQTVEKRLAPETIVVSQRIEEESQSHMGMTSTAKADDALTGNFQMEDGDVPIPQEFHPE